MKKGQISKERQIAILEKLHDECAASFDTSGCRYYRVLINELRSA